MAGRIHLVLGRGSKPEGFGVENPVRDGGVPEGAIEDPNRRQTRLAGREFPEIPVYCPVGATIQRRSAAWALLKVWPFIQLRSELACVRPALAANS